MKNTIRHRVSHGALAVGLVASIGIADTLQADALKEMVEGGKVSLNARARYEYVDSIGGQDVNGYSVRTRLGLTSAEVDGFKAMLELEDVSFANANDRPGLDVPTTEINQAWLSYSSEGASGKLGNQVYTLDDHRFIGHVGWRQNIQTFDALTANVTAGSADVHLAYLSRVNRVNATAQDLDGIVANAAFKIDANHNVSAFGYSLDFNNPGWARMSTQTLGFRATGKFGGEQAVNYALSYANQSDTGANPFDVDLNYLSAEVSTTVSKVKLALGYESLEGDGANGFTTPFSTVHKFAGFADVFAGRSIGLAGGLTQGLDDTYLSANYTVPIGNGLPVTLIYHQFESENNGVDLGEEFDVVSTYPLTESILLLAKYAYYEADLGNTVGYGGTNASMFSIEANFSY